MPAAAPVTIYRLKVSLRDTRPPIWRRVEVPGHVSLRTLHEILNEAMGWTDSHLHSFEIDGREFTDPDPDLDTGRPIEDDRRWRLDEVVTSAGGRFRYEYDFGDGWEHQVTVETIAAASPGVTYPRVTRGARACPPEDCGGTGGYRELLEILADPEHEEYDEYVAWAPPMFDPAAFDLALTNEVLRDRFASVRPARRRKASATTVTAGSSQRLASLRSLAGTPTVTVRSDGTLTLPRGILEALDLEGGGSLLALVAGGSLLLVKVGRF